jgi:hypothetical protein
MNLPSADEYVKIIERKAPGSLAMLHNHRFLLKEDGKTYLYKKGRHSVVFKTEYNSRLYAVRFFLYDDPELFERCHEIQNYLSSKSLPWKIPFEFLDKEYYPVVQMDWIDSLSFSEYLDHIITNPSLLSKLQLTLISLSHSLEQNGIGHGNLNMSHLRFVKQGQEYILKLIDYDSMFIPSFEGKDSLSAGTASFQHPMRLSSDFSETIDRFSFWVFLTALEAFKTNPSLWTNAIGNGYDKSEQILFNFRDLAFPQQSRVFQILKTYNSEALNFYLNTLTRFCNYKSLIEIEAPRIYTENDFLSVDTNDKPFQEVVISDSKPVKAEEIPSYAQTSFLAKESLVEEKALTERKESIQIKNEPAQQKPYVPVKKNNRTRLIVIISIVSLILLTSWYLVSRNQPTEVPPETAAPKKAVVPIQQKTATQETVFTSSNITQFLFQLYQSYNKRDLSAILSNYADSLSQYYDAGALTKNKLADIIKKLFITPRFYECQPDLRTLQFAVEDDVCKLSIVINETIKADKHSKTESYSSKIEYVVDRSFKIHAEKNLE